MPESITKRLRDAGLLPHEVSYIVGFEDFDTKHYCMFCRYANQPPLFISRGRVCAIHYGNMAAEIVHVLGASPIFGIQCANCGAIYKLTGTNK